MTDNNKTKSARRKEMLILDSLLSVSFVFPNSFSSVNPPSKTFGLTKRGANRIYLLTMKLRTYIILDVNLYLFVPVDKFNIVDNYDIYPTVVYLTL